MPLCQLSNLQNANITGKKHSIVLHLDNTTTQHAKNQSQLQQIAKLASRKSQRRHQIQRTFYQLSISY